MGAADRRDKGIAAAGKLVNSAIMKMNELIPVVILNP
jgi:hypothetical protein